MKTLQLQEPIPRGGLGRWLNTFELVKFREVNPHINDVRIRVKRIDRNDDSYGVIIGINKYSWKETNPLTFGIVKQKKECYNRYDITYNKFLEDCCGEDSERFVQQLSTVRKHPSRSHDE